MLTEQPTPCAIVHAWQNERSEIAIKRLALLFDRVYYIPPSFASFKGGPEALLARRREVDPGGPSWIEDFSWWDDVQSLGAIDVRQSSVGTFGETIATLEQANAIVPAVMAPHAAIRQLPDKTFYQTRSAWMQQELTDAEFLRITNTEAGWQEKPIDLRLMTFRVSHGEERTEVWINPPRAWNTSESLTELSYLAAELNAIPAFVEPAQIAGLKRRFEKVSEMLQRGDRS